MSDFKSWRFVARNQQRHMPHFESKAQVKSCFCGRFEMSKSKSCDLFFQISTNTARI